MSRKYYFDELYEDLTRAKNVFYNGDFLARILDWGDKNVVDKLVNGVGWLGAPTLAHRSVRLQSRTAPAIRSRHISRNRLIMLVMYLWFL